MIELSAGTGRSHHQRWLACSRRFSFPLFFWIFLTFFSLFHEFFELFESAKFIGALSSITHSEIFLQFSLLSNRSNFVGALSSIIPKYFCNFRGVSHRHCRSEE
jgi:hypothetical protein